jgi:uncharacterized membrane protein YkvA (DUF1232 family)
MTTPSQNRRSVGFWVELFRSFRLAWQLLRDQHVPLITKLIPLGVLAYILSPIDFVPDAILGLGQLDDLAILLLGVRVFIALVPHGIVQQHRDQMNGVVSQASNDIIDG